MLAARSDHDAADGFASGIYTPEWTERTYQECFARADAALFEGKRVIVDASFRAESQRRRFLGLAADWCVPGILFICQADAGVVKTRLEKRRNDISDADWAIYLEAAQRWESLGARTQELSHAISTDRDESDPLNQALGILRGCELWE